MGSAAKFPLRFGGFKAGMEGSQDWDLIFRISSRVPPERIRHIPITPEAIFAALHAPQGGTP